MKQIKTIFNTEDIFRGENEKYYYFYCITNLLKSKKYWGVHSTFNLNDGYKGSGRLLLQEMKTEPFEHYQKEILECEKISDISERANALLRAEESFNLWMDIYPESEPWLEKLEAQRKHDQFMDYLGLNPKNPE